MLYRVFGANGSGKSEYLLSRLKTAVSEGKMCFWLAPEQQSLIDEKRICRALGDRGTLKCEVLNFERLPNRIARSEGGLTLTATDGGARDLIMSMALKDVKDRLKYYAGSWSDIAFIKNCVSAVSRFKAEGITASRLADAAESADDEKLRGKLHDLSLILESYDSLFTEGLCDPYDSLTLLAERLRESDFFSGCVVFVDGYYTFTYQEYQVLKCICDRCEDCFITFVADDRQMFADNRAAADRIARYAGRYTDVVLPKSTRGRSEGLRHIEKYLWENISPTAPADGSIQLITADNIFDECEAVASEVLNAVRSGMRYRDICILMPDAASYGEIMESTLRRSGIPCFTSHKENAVSKPLISFMLACLEVAYSDFSQRSVRKYLKSGYSPIGVEEGDLLLRYVEMWGIRGHKAYDGDDWMMNPDGFDGMTEVGVRILRCINRARKELSGLLSPLRDTLTDENITVGGIAKALYGHMLQLSVPDKLASKAERMAAHGDADGAERERQLMDIAVSILDRLYTTAGDRTMPLKQLSDIIECMAGEYSVGSIPSSLDAVATGDPRLFRADGCRVVMICGVSDGVFPSYSKGNLFFDDDELTALEGQGINLTVAGDAYIRRERFLFYMACTSPSQKLVLTHPVGSISGEKIRPSLGFLRMSVLFPDIKIRHFGENETDYIYSLATAAARCNAISDPALRQAVANAVEKAGGHVDTSRSTIFDSDVKISFDPPREFGISPSAFEKYVYCPFSYFASQLMHLKKRDRIKLAQAQAGVFIHKALEEYMRACTAGGVFLPMDDAHMRAEAERAVNEYLPVASEKRFSRLCGSLRRTLKELYKNLNSEFGVCSFMPVGFEVRIGRGEEIKKPLTVTVDGTDVYVRGKVDRVDEVTVDGKKYIRITDYKSGGKTFNMDLIEEGLETQMPMYLFSVCDSKGAQPAGCVYYTAKLTYVDRIAGESDRELEKRVQRTISRSGIYRDDMSLIMAADSSEEGLFRPVRITSNGTVHKSDQKKLLSDEQLARLKDKLGEKMYAVAEGIFRGNMSITPKHIDRDHDACRYCDFRRACRYERRH